MLKQMTHILGIWLIVISIISIITQVIIEILALSLAENGVIFRYDHLRRGDYSRRTNFQRGGRNRIGRREKWPKKSWEEGEIGGKSRVEGEKET